MTDKFPNEAEVVIAAKAAGLHKAVDQFPDDVRAAAKAAAQARNAFSPPGEPTVEPWPPMRTGGGV